MDIAMSYSATSTCCPRPSRSRAINASRIALQADIPVAMSTIGGPVLTGGPSGKPFKDMNPLSACVIGSKPGREAKGPLRPYAEIEQYTKRGLVGATAG